MLWALARPFRVLAKSRKLPKGRALAARVAHRVAWGTIQAGTPIAARTPAGCRVVFGSETLIARALWTFGAFEQEELSAAGRLAKLGTCAIDVGANVGLFTVELSRAVGPEGLVIALEPVTSTAEQLQSNLDRNRCANIDVVVGAAGPVAGRIELFLSDDPALHSAGQKPIAGRAILGSIIVPAYTLDDLWAAAGRPRVGFVKIDVEGGELGVLLGATRMISACRPHMIVEVPDRERLDEILAILPGYRLASVRGFEPWNHLLVPQ